MEISVLLVGARQRAQSLVVKPDGIVWNLFQAIESENPTFFAGVSSCYVFLYLAKQEGGQWIKTDGPEARALMTGHGPVVEAICRTPLLFHESLDTHFSDLGSGHTHLLVRARRPPETLGKRESFHEVVYEVLWCRLVGDSNTSSFPVAVDMAGFVYNLQVVLRKARFGGDDEVHATDIYPCKAVNSEGNWLSRYSSDVEEIQRSTEVRKALHPGLKLRDVFHSLGPDDLNVMFMTSPMYVVAPTMEHWHLTESYRRVAEELKKDCEVDELVKDIEQISQVAATSPYLTPFVVLQNSSGTGKTQMAFNLMARKEVEVFYIFCGEQQGGVELAFGQRSESFLRCVEKDLPGVFDARIFTILPHMSLYTFGFIWALLTGRSWFMDPRRPVEVRKELKARPKGSRQIVVFLDEFPRLDDSSVRTSDIARRFMLNVLRSFGLAVVLSTTSGAARDLATLDIGRCLQQSGRLWCTVRPMLPTFRPHHAQEIPLDLQLVLRNSRPSIAALVVDYSSRNPLAADFVSYMDGIAGVVANTFAPKEKFVFEAFRVGQLSLFLRASYGTDDFTRNMARPEDTSQLIGEHFARLHETAPLKLALGCEDHPGEFEGGLEAWQCHSELPTTEEDCLLHLCLSGGKHFEALKDSNGTPLPFVQAFLDAEKVPYSVLQYLSTDKPHYDRIRLEMLVAGAIVASSHRNGLAGIKFPQFLSALLYELGIQSSPDLQLRFPETLAESVASLTVSFLAPPGLTWAEYLMRTEINLGLVELERNENRSSVLVPRFNRTTIRLLGRRITVACYREQLQLTADAINDMLARIPRESAVHLVVMKSLRSLCFRKQDKNRKKRLEDALKSLDSLRHAYFYRVLASEDWTKSGHADLVAIRYMKNECRSSVPCEQPACKVQKLVLFLEVSK